MDRLGFRDFAEYDIKFPEDYNGYVLPAVHNERKREVAAKKAEEAAASQSLGNGSAGAVSAVATQVNDVVPGLLPNDFNVFASEQVKQAVINGEVWTVATKNANSTPYLLQYDGDMGPDLNAIREKMCDVGLAEWQLMKRSDADVEKLMEARGIQDRSPEAIKAYKSKEATAARDALKGPTLHQVAYGAPFADDTTFNLDEELIAAGRSEAERAKVKDWFGDAAGALGKCGGARAYRATASDAVNTKGKDGAQALLKAELTFMQALGEREIPSVDICGVKLEENNGVGGVLRQLFRFLFDRNNDELLQQSNYKARFSRKTTGEAIAKGDIDLAAWANPGAQAMDQNTFLDFFQDDFAHRMSYFFHIGAKFIEIFKCFTPKQVNAARNEVVVQLGTPEQAAERFYASQVQPLAIRVLGVQECTQEFAEQQQGFFNVKAGEADRFGNTFLLSLETFNPANVVMIDHEYVDDKGRDYKLLLLFAMANKTNDLFWMIDLHGDAAKSTAAATDPLDGTEKFREGMRVLQLFIDSLPKALAKDVAGRITVIVTGDFNAKTPKEGEEVLSEGQRQMLKAGREAAICPFPIVYTECGNTTLKKRKWGQVKKIEVESRGAGDVVGLGSSVYQGLQTFLEGGTQKLQQPLPNRQIPEDHAAAELVIARSRQAPPQFPIFNLEWARKFQVQMLQTKEWKAANMLHEVIEEAESAEREMANLSLSASKEARDALSKKIKGAPEAIENAKATSEKMKEKLTAAQNKTALVKKQTQIAEEMRVLVEDLDAQLAHLGLEKIHVPGVAKIHVPGVDLDSLFR